MEAADLHETDNEDADQRNLHLQFHLQIGKDPDGKSEHQNIGQQRQAGSGQVEGTLVDAMSSLDGRVPVDVDRPALEDDSKKNGDHQADIGIVNNMDCRADTRLLSTETEQEQQDRCLDQSKNWVVEHLDDKVPDHPWF